LALIALTGVATSGLARADVVAEAAALFAADSFPETEVAIGKLASSGHPQAQAILEALASRRLLLDPASKALGLQDGRRTLDAATGKPRDEFPTDAAVVRTNNRLRGMIEVALGSLALSAPDPQRRLQAIEAITKARDAAALPRLDVALTRETDARVKAAIATARATIALADPKTPAAEQLAAIAALAGRSDADTANTLRTVARSDNASVRLAAEAALVSLERRRQITGYVQNVWYGLSLGSVLLLAAAGLAITFGVMGVINMAHGEMVMIGAYVTYVVQQGLKSAAPGLVEAGLVLAIPTAFLVAGAVGIAIERGIIRFLYGRPLETLLATWGVSLVLQQAVRSYFGASNVQVAAPSYMSGSFDFMGLQITYGRLWIIVFTLLAFAALQVFIRTSALGLQMRAVTQNRRMAGAMGIRTGRVDALTFGLGCGIAGIAGVALSQIDNVAPNLGQSYIVDCFMVVVFGGVGSLWGTLVSAFSLGIANKLLEPVVGAVLAKIFILLLLVLFIQKRPRGLFALKGRAVEA
jgi:urea transport system permease protein